jgi:hypothetical protein
MPIHIDIPLRKEEISAILQSRITGKRIQPELVTPEIIRAPEAYTRLQDIDIKNEFRMNLLQHLHDSWLVAFGGDKATELSALFESLADTLNNEGAAIFGDLIDKSAFQQLVNKYDQILKEDGSKSWIHSYINLGNHPDYLTNSEFNGAFLHPLLIAMISYAVGGAIHLVDARGKNAEPLSILAQDNMLHIDNTPFRSEYKIITTWQEGLASGPKGQNFVYIPGTHKGVRNCFIDADGKAWSTENGSIFITDEAIDQVFEIQKTLHGSKAPTVVEVKHDDKPLTTVFAAGSLVHHRYRTEEGFKRSCSILAFHRIVDNPREYMTKEHVDKFSHGNDLNRFLFGKVDGDVDQQFLVALTERCGDIAEKITEIYQEESSAELIMQHEKTLSEAELQKWKKHSTRAPTVEAHKRGKDLIPLNEELNNDDLHQTLSTMMFYDKHGPLDLILYGDNHEEIRKWARNRIREMKVNKINMRLSQWIESISQPSTTDLLDNSQLQQLAMHMAAMIDNLTDEEKAAGRLDPIEKISSQNAFASIRQLVVDLAEALGRSDTRQNFLTTSLFLFWACDELNNLQSDRNDELKHIGNQLLANYISTAIIIEKQIKNEEQLTKLPKRSDVRQGVFLGDSKCSSFKMADDTSCYLTTSQHKYN